MTGRIEWGHNLEREIRTSGKDGDHEDCIRADGEASQRQVSVGEALRQDDRLPAEYLEGSEEDWALLAVHTSQKLV